MSLGKLASTTLDLGDGIAHRRSEVLGADFGNVDRLVEIVSTLLGGVEVRLSGGESVRALAIGDVAGAKVREHGGGHVGLGVGADRGRSRALAARVMLAAAVDAAL